MRRFFLLLLVVYASAQQTPRIVRRNDAKDSSNQNLPPPKEPPAAVTADEDRLTFQVSPLSNKGLLTPQVRDALKELMQANHGGRLIKLRAFVAGTGDLRRVQALTSEIFADKKEPLPALTVVQVGALPLEGAQVVMEGVSEDKKIVNPNGLEFFSGPAQQIEAPAGDVVQASCFLSSMQALDQKLPHMAFTFVQPLRDPLNSISTCEAVRRHGSGGATGNLVFTGLQMAFGEQDADIKLAFERLGKTLEAQGSSYSDVVNAKIYALTPGVAEKAAAIGRQFMNAPHAPLLVENLPSIDASLGIEVVAAVRK